MTCPSSPVNVGDTVTFTIRATDADANLYSAGLYFSQTSAQDWRRLNNDGSLGTDLTPNIGLSGGSRTITATWQPTASDANKSFYVVPQIFDSSGKKCTSNPWGNPAGFVDCSDQPEDSRCQIQVNGFPNCKNLTAASTALVGDSASKFCPPAKNSIGRSTPRTTDVANVRLNEVETRSIELASIGFQPIFTSLSRRISFGDVCPQDFDGHPRLQKCLPI